MRIKFTRHALERMYQRGISPKDVKEAVNHPDIVLTSGNVKKYVKRIDRLLLVIIARPVEDGLLVITTFKTSQVKKFGRW